MGLDVNECDITVMSKELQTDEIKEKRTEITKDVGTEKNEAVRRDTREDEGRKVLNKNIVDTIPKDSGVAELEAGPELEVLTFAMNKCCFIRNILFKDFEDNYELDTGSALVRK